MNKSPFAGSNIHRVKKHNLRAILLTFLHNDLISRSQLAEFTGLSNTTITNLAAELIDQDIVVEVDSLDKSLAKTRRRVGRPQRMLQLIPDARFVVGVHIGIGMFRVAVANLHAEIVFNKMCQFSVTQPSYEVLDTIARVIRETVDESQIDRQLVLGIGVGASGLVDYRNGVNVRAASLGWRDVPIREKLEMRLQLPVIVDNNVRAMALGEANFGLGRGVNVLAFIYGRIGVGAGIVVNGQAFRGGGAGAGEIGHTIVLPANGERCRCGQYGCLETLVSEPVLLREAQVLAAELPQSILARNLANRALKPIDAVFDAARAGDRETMRMIEDQMHYLGIALANLVNILNPELIILGGMFAQGSDLILPEVETTMRELAFAGLGDNVDLRPTAFGWRAGVIGAASLALKEFFYEMESEQAILA